MVFAHWRWLLTLEIFFPPPFIPYTAAPSRPRSVFVNSKKSWNLFSKSWTSRRTSRIRCICTCTRKTVRLVRAQVEWVLCWFETCYIWLKFSPHPLKASMEQLPGPSSSSSNFNVSELMHQLQVTNDELANLRVSSTNHTHSLSLFPPTIWCDASLTLLYIYLEHTENVTRVRNAENYIEKYLSRFSVCSTLASFKVSFFDSIFFARSNRKTFFLSESSPPTWEEFLHSLKISEKNFFLLFSSFSAALLRPAPPSTHIAFWHFFPYVLLPHSRMIVSVHRLECIRCCRPKKPFRFGFWERER